MFSIFNKIKIKAKRIKKMNKYYFESVDFETGRRVNK